MMMLSSDNFVILFDLYLIFIFIKLKFNSNHLMTIFILSYI
jgi:hypothetical protein